MCMLGPVTKPISGFWSGRVSHQHAAHYEPTNIWKSFMKRTSRASMLCLPKALSVVRISSQTVRRPSGLSIRAPWEVADMVNNLIFPYKVGTSHEDIDHIV